jgi:hypothetical protein
MSVTLLPLATYPLSFLTPGLGIAGKGGRGELLPVTGNLLPVTRLGDAVAR